LALLAWIKPPLVVVGLSATAGAYVFMQRRLTAAYDQDLGDIARALVPYLLIRNGRIDLVFNEQSDAVLRADSNDQIFYAVRDEQGRMVAGDESLPLLQAPHDGGVSFTDALRSDSPIRAASLAATVDGRRVSVVAAETTRKRDSAARDALLSALAPTVLLLFAAAAAVVFGVRRGLAPVEELGSELRSRSHIDLRALPESQLAIELQPLAHALNDMFLRLQGAQTAQARFIANAAHQLRTPIAGLLTQIDLARDGEDAATHLAHARDAAGRLARLAQQILSLAAADPVSNPSTPSERFDLAAVMREHAVQWVRSYRDAELGFELSPAEVVGQPVLVGEMASNLVDNATRYGGTSVTIRTRASADGTARLEVEDNGRGIPAEARVLIFERFRRLEGTNSSGSGLGLAIVQEIAQRHRARVTIEEGSAGGTLVTVLFAPVA
jgi:two-component system sensor histidine kinase TctE